jgi:hypothetical protein
MTFEAVAVIFGIGYVCFRHWLRHDKRRMLHRERLAALEAGRELPAAEQESSHSRWNVQRFLLVAGISWVAVGLGGGLTFFVILRQASPEWVRQLPPAGTEIAAIIPIGIGLAHLITFWAGERRDRRSQEREAQ